MRGPPNAAAGSRDRELRRRPAARIRRQRGGFVLDLPSSQLALSIEDNHIDSSAPHTLLTLSTGVVF